MTVDAGYLLLIVGLLLGTAFGWYLRILWVGLITAGRALMVALRRD